MDAFTLKLEETRKQLEQFIQQARAELESKNATLREYELLFQKCETVLPSFAEFVNRVAEGLKTASVPMSLPTSARVSEPSASPSTSPSSKPVARASKSVLVVDDAEINRVLMGHYFKALPVKIEFSMSGPDAIEKCRAKKFDLILMDLQMKDMDGIEAARQIRAFEKSTPIFAVTNSEPTAAEEQEALSAGCTRYLSKGISKETLREQVSEALW